jgi:hypothetical protein
MEELYHLLSILAALCVSLLLVDVPGMAWLVKCCDVYLLINTALYWMILLR